MQQRDVRKLPFTYIGTAAELVDDRRFRRDFFRCLGARSGTRLTAAERTARARAAALASHR
jgi:hypothetical protein